MNTGKRMSVLVCVALAGCFGGIELTGSAEGYESFGRVGGNVETPDGAVEVEIDKGTIAGEVVISIGRLDDCIAGALACYEIEPTGLKFPKPVKVTFDLVGVEGSALIDAQSLSAYVNEGGIWRQVNAVSTDAELTTLELTTLGPVALVPSTPGK